MRKILFSFFPLFFFNSIISENLHQAPGMAAQSSKGGFDPGDWIIDEATANRMITNYNHCKGKCKASKKQVRNSEVENYIQSNYTILNRQPLMARYTDEDVVRYKKSRKIADNEEKGNVNGYTTVITKYMVVPKNGTIFPGVTILFVDDCFVCPPPDNSPCN